VIGGACGWGLSALVGTGVHKSRVDTLRTGDKSAALTAGLELLDNRGGMAVLMTALENFGTPPSVPAKNRVAAAEALGGYEGLREPMLALSGAAIDDPDAEVRLECVRLIAAFTQDRFFRALREIARSLPTEADPEVQEAKRRLLTLAVFTESGEAATCEMSSEELSRECRARLGEAMGEVAPPREAPGEDVQESG
jgi:hypothetical protein